MASTRRETFDGILFDMDGTLIHSIGAVEAHWTNVREDLQITPEAMSEILLTMHGTRSIDILKAICPEKANWNYVRTMEARLPREFASSSAEIPGTKALITALEEQQARWGIVTSGSQPLVTGWLDVLGIATPNVLVSGEDVELGKPDPMPYLVGRKKLGVHDPRVRVLVGEDSSTGIRAAKAAGCFVVGILSSATVEELRAAGADAIVRDWTQVKVVSRDHGAVTLEIQGDLLCTNIY